MALLPAMTGGSRRKLPLSHDPAMLEPPVLSVVGDSPSSRHRRAHGAAGVTELRCDRFKCTELSAETPSSAAALTCSGDPHLSG